MTADPAAADIAREVLAYHAAIPSKLRAEVLLDWHAARHWRHRPGVCVHCHSPEPTNLVDDHGRYSHKTCAEISAYLAGPPPPVEDEEGEGAMVDGADS